MTAPDTEHLGQNDVAEITAAAAGTEVDESRQPFAEHLHELRRRTIRAVLYLIVGFGLAWVWHEPIFDWLMEPLASALRSHGVSDDRIGFRAVTEPIKVYLMTSLMVGGLAVLPLIFLEVWLFVAPGLYKSERRLAVPFLVSSVICFTIGVAFCRYVVLDPAVDALIGFGGESTSAEIMMAEYFSFTARMLFIFGVMFELPVATSFFAIVGLLTHRGLFRNWRYAIVAAFVFGAMFTPPDPLTQIALAVPLVGLYGVAILLAYFITKARESGGEA